MTQQDSDFNIGRIVLASVTAATLGATGMLIFSAAMSLDWSLGLPMTLHLAIAFAIAGACLSATFASDSEMDEGTVETVHLDALRPTLNEPTEISAQTHPSAAA